VSDCDSSRQIRWIEVSPWSSSVAHPRPHPHPDIVRASHAGPRWTKCREFGNELEASIAVAILDGAGIPAIVRSNDSVGLFGSAFQGFSAMGVSLLVPSDALEAARTTLALAERETE